MAKHKWKMSWPGNYCLKCGASDPTEEALADGVGLIDCPHCDSGCEACCYTGCAVGPAVELDEECPVGP